MLPDRRGERQAALRRRLADTGVDGLLVTHPPNIRYLSGFSGSAGMLLIGRDRAVLVTDPRYRSQAAVETKGAAEAVIEPVNLWHRLRPVLEDQALSALAFESSHLTVASAARLGETGAARLEPVDGAVEALRVVKDDGEVHAIREAAALALEAFAATLPAIRVGARECDVAARLEHELRTRGSEWHPFATIVASGPRSALPHARTTHREVRAGEWLLMDFGAMVNGYCADLTRTVVVGRADDCQRERYDAVRAAQTAALRGMRAGMPGREIDALARTVLAAAGLGEAFQHSLGHGLGLEVHEEPRLATTAQGEVPAGAVVTVEPGVYLEGWGGVRLEDDVYLSAQGPMPVSPGAPDLLEVH